MLISDIALRQHQSGTPIYQLKVESDAKCRWGVDKTRWGSKFSSAKPVEGKKDQTLTSRQTQCSERIKIYIYIHPSCSVRKLFFHGISLNERPGEKEGTCRCSAELCPVELTAITWLSSFSIMMNIDHQYGSLTCISSSRRRHTLGESHAFVRLKTGRNTTVESTMA